jgi:hypothetical protein
MTLFHKDVKDEFWQISDEEILAEIREMTAEWVPNIIYDRNRLAYDEMFQILANMWLNCNKDKMMMKLRYHEEIENMPLPAGPNFRPTGPINWQKYWDLLPEGGTPIGPTGPRRVICTDDN